MIMAILPPEGPVRYRRGLGPPTCRAEEALQFMWKWRVEFMLAFIFASGVTSIVLEVLR